MMMLSCVSDSDEDICPIVDLSDTSHFLLRILLLNGLYGC